MLKRVRGITISTEAILVSGIMVVLLALAFIYATGYLRATPRLSQTWVEAKLCGSVLTIMNTGSTTAYISGLYYVDSTGRMVDATYLLSPSQRVVNPGTDVVVKLNGAYGMVVIVGENFDAVKARNECTTS